MAKIYAGSAKARDTQFGEQLTVTVTLEVLEENFKEYGYITKNGKRNMTLKLSRRKEVGQYGETHTVEVDTWKPENKRQDGSNSGSGNSYQSSQQNAPTASVARPESNQPPDYPDDIPF